MAYCRFSSDDWQCDVYVYESVHGAWEIHVADRRRCLLPGREFPPDLPDLMWGAATEADRRSWAAACLLRHRSVRWALGMGDDVDNDDVSWEELPPPYGGKSFYEPTPKDCADRLEEIRAAGLNVPQYAIDALREESDEEAVA